MAKPSEVLRFLVRSSKRVAVTIVGAALVLGGAAMLVLPGPGILVIAGGFAVLGTEYAWAAIAFQRTKDAAATAGRVGKNAARSAARGVRRRGK
ncbi:MAG TPA: PGPGW domain-containing protein [Frankiaceae bacterium]|nr:PGPGW domain-containing protein [Frankiaceae bacterium]